MFTILLMHILIIYNVKLQCAVSNSESHFIASLTYLTFPRMCTCVRRARKCARFTGVRLIVRTVRLLSARCLSAEMHYRVKSPLRHLKQSPARVPPLNLYETGEK